MVEQAEGEIEHERLVRERAESTLGLSRHYCLLTRPVSILTTVQILHIITISHKCITIPKSDHP